MRFKESQNARKFWAELSGKLVAEISAGRSKAGHAGWTYWALDKTGFSTSRAGASLKVRNILRHAAVQ